MRLRLFRLFSAKSLLGRSGGSGRQRRKMESPGHGPRCASPARYDPPALLYGGRVQPLSSVAAFPVNKARERNRL